MAKKHARETFAEMLKALEAESSKNIRKVEAIEERKYFLIVCEGERTEPIYFDYLKNFLPKNMLDTIKIIGQGDNTINVVNKAIEERNKRQKNELLPDFDEAWAVFDKDDFPKEQFNEAVNRALLNGIKSGHSNQAFELWYVLHFDFLQTALHRQDYFKRLTEILGEKYLKNSANIVERVFKEGNVQRAITWARTLDEMHDGKTPSNSCPLTKIYLLVENLLLYSNSDLLEKKSQVEN